jgi:hypothetical protein
LKDKGFKVRHGRYKEEIVLYSFQYGKEIVQTTTSDQVMLKMACIKARVVGDNKGK